MVSRFGSVFELTGAARPPGERCSVAARNNYSALIDRCKSISHNNLRVSLVAKEKWAVCKLFVYNKVGPVARFVAVQKRHPGTKPPNFTEAARCARSGCGSHPMGPAAVLIENGSMGPAMVLVASGTKRVPGRFKVPSGCR
jgi:hypothetical protein